MSIFWVVWIVLIAVTFAAGEAFALLTDRSTLSRFVWNVSKAFPPFPWLVGMLFGALGVHFFWTAQDCAPLVGG